MAVLNREQFFDAVNNVVGTDTSEDSLKFLEDMQDTYGSLTEDTNSEAEEWKEKYLAMKAKYRHRFLGGTPGRPETIEDLDKEREEEERAKNIIIDDLFSSPGKNAGKEIK